MCECWGIFAAQTIRKMNNTETKLMLIKLSVFRNRHRNTGILITKLLKDIDSKVLVLPQNLQEEYRAQALRQYGNHIRKGQLQAELERELSGILTELQRDFPYFTKQDQCIFCYSAAGFPDYLIARLSNISTGKRVSARRGRLIELISNSHKDRRSIYLAMLSKKEQESATLPKDQSGRNQDLL